MQKSQKGTWLHAKLLVGGLWSECQFYFRCRKRKDNSRTWKGNSASEIVRHGYLFRGAKVNEIAIGDGIIRKETFTPEQTRTFFEGLLPEGFTRRTVAHFIHADENDYLKILAALGKECLGALRVTDETDSKEETEDYEEITIEEIKALAKEGATKSAELVTKAHLSLTGASGKVGLYYDEKENKWYLPKGTAPSTHIVKQSHIRLNAIVANEQLSLLTARKMGRIFRHATIRCDDSNVSW